MTTHNSHDALRADIADDLAHATEIMGQIARLLAAGEYASASVRADYLQGRIKSMERTQKLIGKGAQVTD